MAHNREHYILILSFLNLFNVFPLDVSFSPVVSLGVGLNDEGLNMLANFLLLVSHVVLSIRSFFTVSVR